MICLENINKFDLIIIVGLLFLAPFFFFKLGQSSLVSFDEAWYADIASNIIASGDFINLTWNGNPYIDHPPAGFWLIAISEKVWGDNEFGVRFAPSFLGLASLIVIYFLGKQLFNRWVGLAAALALSSSFWFLFRARSGNLDVILTFFFLLTFYLAIKASQKKKFLWPFCISLIFLFLTKTLVPFAIIPSLIIIFWKTKYRWKEIRWPILVSLVCLAIWLLNQLLKNPNFLQHYFSIGLPGVHVETNYLENLKLVKEYLHSGIGKWFWPGIFSVIASLFLRQKIFLILAVFLFSFLLPAIFSAKVHIWHLIPVHPILILSFLGLSFVILEKLIRKKSLVWMLILMVSLYISSVQWKISLNQFIDVPAFVSDEAILSKEAGKYNLPFFIDGDFVQSAVFYSGKNVSQIQNGELKEIFKQKNEVIIITYQWRLDQEKIPAGAYEVIKHDRDKLLILKTPVE